MMSLGWICVLSLCFHRFFWGILAEILEFLTGKGLILADGEIWSVRQCAIVPAIALHQKVVMWNAEIASQRWCHGQSRKAEQVQYPQES
ncbi:hypothetical protein RHSIM_RhsimUnG0006500 [Rhododendron simsii]|uniref:Uncharacterized protein n=1 Tax=Rhododendron simsii TaxID=118357 RepID=A0A834L367_RHOSS|nr:hypothetical protein RHSIM_RhsimUnG0006500 [Rhododendron simsii]